MDIHVVGGCYLEVCCWPSIEELHGSAGRAAEAIAHISQSSGTHLHTVLPEKHHNDLQKNFALLDCELHITEATDVVSFYYNHPLAIPEITPSLETISSQEPIQLSIETSNAVIFGMLEAETKVIAKNVVYDPQNAHNPTPFSETNNTAESLALILNLGEAKSMWQRLQTTETSEEIEIEELSEQLLKKEQAEVLVIKCGQRGALVKKAGCSPEWVPAFETPKVYPIGSGDCFVATFAYFWIEEKIDPLEAAFNASLATAYYCEHRTYPIKSDFQRLRDNAKALKPSSTEDKKIYLAGPFFNLKEMWLINETRRALMNFGVNVFSPYHDVGVGSAEEVVEHDVKAIEECEVMYALFDGGDPGTLFEIGYAIKAGKTVVIYSENATEEELKMYEGTGCIICHDFSTSIYKACWALSE